MHECNAAHHAVLCKRKMRGARCESVRFALKRTDGQDMPVPIALVRPQETRDRGERKMEEKDA